MNEVNIASLFAEGTQKLMDAHSSLESTKAGTLRAGNAGLFLAERGGTWTGNCARRTLLRYLGIDLSETEDDFDASASKELMFEAGRSNEDLWYTVLKESWGERGVILREEEIPISWMTTSGVAVTGRPDLVLCTTTRHEVTGEEQVSPTKGIELKLICSLWTARTVGFALTPKLPHLIQAVHYSWQLGVPFELWYTNRVNFAINCENPERGRRPDWKIGLFPAPGEAGSERIKYSFWREEPSLKWGWKKIEQAEWEQTVPAKRRAVPKDILPFRQGYEIQLHRERPESPVLFRPVGTDRWTPSVVTLKGIEEYYENIARIATDVDSDDELPPRPKALKVDGRAEAYRDCNYCPLASICDRAEKLGKREWLRQVQESLSVGERPSK